MPLYTIERTVQEDGVIFDDKAHIIYVNGENKDDTALRKLMQDFSCKVPENMNYELLAEKTKYFKQDDKGVSKMCKIMEDYDKKDDRKVDWKENYSHILTL